jgi:hypothetical protein
MTVKRFQRVGCELAVARACLAAVLTAAAWCGVAQPAPEQDQQDERERQEQRQEQGQEVVTAVFKAHEVGFSYRASRSNLPCYELEGRIATILVAVGARDDLEVDVIGCDEFVVQNDPLDDAFHDAFGSRDRFGTSMDRYRGRRSSREDVAHIRVRLMTLVELTPKIMEEIKRDKSRRELISRVTRKPEAAMNDPIIYAAQRQEVTLSRRTIRLDAEDCELLDQMSKSVFRKLGVRVVRGTLNCDRNSRLPPQLTVETLLPVGIAPQPGP